MSEKMSAVAYIYRKKMARYDELLQQAEDLWRKEQARRGKL